MIKQKKLMIGLGALLVVCLVAVIAIVVYQPKEENTKSETVTFATYESKDDILAVTIKNENGEWQRQPGRLWPGKSCGCDDSGG